MCQCDVMLLCLYRGLLVTLDDLRSTLLTYCNEPMTADLKLEILLVIQQVTELIIKCFRIL